MTSRHLNETADEYAHIIVMINSRQRVIRCRNNQQWICQKRTSADLNKGHWVGLSYHTSWKSLTARYSGVRKALNYGLRSYTASEHDIVLDDYDGRG